MGSAAILKPGDPGLVGELLEERRGEDGGDASSEILKPGVDEGAVLQGSDPIDVGRGVPVVDLAAVGDEELLDERAADGVLVEDAPPGNGGEEPRELALAGPGVPAPTRVRVSGRTVSGAWFCR